MNNFATNIKVMKNFKLILTLILFLIAFCASAQWGENDGTFNPIDKISGTGGGLDNGANQVIVQPDKKIIIVSHSAYYNGNVKVRIVRTDSNGNVDSSFNVGTGFNFSAMCAALQADGKILVGGEFTSYDGKTTNRIARLHPDGSLDTTFRIGKGAQSFVTSIVVQPDKKILVAGGFGFFNDTFFNGIVRLFPNGNIDTSFKVGSGIAQINSVAVQNDGKIILVGNFIKYDNTNNAVRIVRVDVSGRLDTTFKSGQGFPKPPECLAVQADGKILVGGDFTSYNTVARNRLVRLNTDGSLDTGFSIGSGFNKLVSSIIVKADSSLIIGGGFDQFNGSTRYQLAGLTKNGNLDSSFTHAFVGGGISSICEFDNNRLMMVGNFSYYGGIYRFGANRIYQSGKVDLTFNSPTGFDYDVHKVVVQSDGKILVGGFFSIYNGVPKSSLVRLLPNGELDTSFLTGTGFTNTFGGPTDIRVIAIQTDGKILVGGGGVNYFYNGKKINPLVRLHPNGVLDTTFTASITSAPNALTIQADGKILVSIGSGIKRLNTDGSNDATLNQGSGFSGGSGGDVTAILVQPDGKIIAAGNFTSYNGTSRQRIIRISATGAIDNSFSIGNGFDGRVSTMTFGNNGSIWVGGSGFSKYNGTSRNKIARLKSDGTLDTTFKPGSGFSSEVFSIIAQKDGKILVAGSLYQYDTTTIGHLLRLDSTGKIDSSYNYNHKFNKKVTTIDLQYGQNIIAGGFFTAHHTAARNRIARVVNFITPEYDRFDTVCTRTYTFNAITYTKDTVAKHNFINSKGGDSIVILHLTFKPLKDSIQVSACDSFLSPSGKFTWKQSGVYKDTLIASSGCDSIISVKLTIYKAALVNLFRTACDSYSSPSGKQVWYNSGIYYDTLVTSKGCDSVLKINLVINKSSSSTQNITACNSYKWLLNNATYTSSGTYTTKLANKAGCDSIVTLNLIVNKSTSSVSVVTSCESYKWPANGQTYTTSGTYTATLINSKGCDSLLTLNLTVIKIDIGVTNFPPVLTANTTIGTYQWLNCNNGFSKIAGQTGRTFTATTNGNYAVEITQNGCKDTSACINLTGIGINNIEKDELRIFPNPVNDKLIIEFSKEENNTEVIIKSLTGQILSSLVVNSSNQHEISLAAYPAGVYFIEIKRNSSETVIRKVLKN